MKYVWPESTRNELRGVERETALRILHALTKFGESGVGDVKMLSGQWQGYYRLRVGDFRIIFTISTDEITIVRVRHQSESYR